MAQTTRSVVAEVSPDSAGVLRDLIDGLRTNEEKPPPGYAKAYDHIKAAVPSLHFMSLTVFDDPQYDPILVFECNFDGETGPFFAQLESAFAPLLRDMLRCCKPPPAPADAMFAAIVTPQSRTPIAPLLEALTVRPAVFHHGNRGITRDCILREAALFCAVQDELDGSAQHAQAGAYHAQDIVSTHRMLRDRLLPRFDWLARPEPPRITPAEDRADKARLAAFVILVILVLAAPGVLLSLALPVWAAGLVLTLALVWAGRRLGWLRELDAAPDKPVSRWLVRFAIILPVAFLVLSLLPQHGLSRAVVLLLSWIGALPVTLVLLLLWLRALERRDPSLDAPVQDSRSLRELAASEDQIDQNHMISIVHIKPGVLRAALIRAGLWGLGLVLRVQPGARAGYLGSMRTIHFAHWALVSNGARLMFHSNFDGTWESYLDDFIEKAHGGLSLAWTSAVGFPSGRFLVLDGASQGRKFKAWARHSMTASRFWFSAYRDLTVNQIERQRRIADGLRQPQLSQQEAETWALDL